MDTLVAVACSTLIASAAYALKRWADSRWHPGTTEAEVMAMLRHVSAAIADLERKRESDARDVAELRRLIAQGAPWLSQRS